MRERTTNQRAAKRRRKKAPKVKPEAHEPQLPTAILNLPRKYRLQLIEDLAGVWADDETIGEAFAFLYEKEKRQGRRKRRAS